MSCDVVNPRRNIVLRNIAYDTKMEMVEHARLIFIMEIPIAAKTVFIIRRGPGL